MTRALMALQPEPTNTHLEGLRNRPCPCPEFLIQEVWGWQSVCISDKFPGAVAAAHPGTRLLRTLL